MTDIVLVLSTVASAQEGETIASALVGERLAACVSVLPPMTSIYRWQDAVERASECQVVVKTTRARLESVMSRLRQLHSYDVPELLVVPVADGGAAYLEWIRRETSPSASDAARSR
jgi:periplasmic divalent cation tolerance protein